jgi:4-amino-4-deoxy-L-arabinose transferase-like glycosyltransferase
MQPSVAPRVSPPLTAPSESAPVRNIVEWLPYLWSKVLFPGRAEPAQRTRPAALAFLVVVAAIVVLPALNFHLFEPDEGRYAQIPSEMLDRGDWLVPVLQGEPYLDKPPLLYWLVMIAYRIFGEADWVARLVPASAAILCVIAAYVLGRRVIGERPAFWGGMFLALAPGLASMGRILVLDGLLTLFVTVGLLALFHAVNNRSPRSRYSGGEWPGVRGQSHEEIAAFRDAFEESNAPPSINLRWWRFASLAIALGMLTKGPIAFVLVLPPILAHRWLTSQPARIPRRAWFELAAIVLAVNAPWYIAITVREPEFASYFLWKHNLQRFLTPFDHEEPIWYFLPVLLLGLLPIAWMLPLVGRSLLSKREHVIARRSAEFGFCLLAGLWCVGFFSLSGSKLPTYILPAFPMLCLALGAYAVATGWTANRWFRGGLLAWGVILIVGHTVVLPAVAWERSPMNHAPEARPYLDDRDTPVYCYPRPVDSVAFYLGRNDFQVYRSKELAEMLQSMDKHRRSVVLFAHRNSKLILTHNVPPHFRVIYVGKLGLCDMAVIER